ncbi:universal stress protein [Hymenobacter tenuis]
MNTSLVVLTNFFAVSNHAISYAAGLAVPLQAQLVLLHLRHDGLLSPEEYYSRQAQSGQPAASPSLQQLAAQQPVPTEVDVSDEFLTEAIQESVARHHPLLLVLGRPGSASMPDEVVTSTVMDLLRHSPYPLLIVPTVGWDLAAPTRLMLAVDGEPFTLFPHQDVLRRLLTAVSGTLEVVHVTDDEHPRADKAAVLRTISANDLVTAPSEAHLHEVYQPHVAGGILQEVARQEADMLVVVARRHSLLGSMFHRSVTAQLIQESPVPVLVLPAED